MRRLPQHLHISQLDTKHRHATLRVDNERDLGAVRLESRDTSLAAVTS